MSFDPKKYLHHFDDCDMSDDEKTELIETLWMVAQSFVDRAFDQSHVTANDSPLTEPCDLSGQCANIPHAANDNTETLKTKGTAIS